jgi:hypothetical protein
MARPRSIRFRYTLRALLVGVTLFCLWGGFHSERAWREREAEKVLKRHHASIYGGPSQTGDGFVNKARFSYQKLVQLVWRERFITSVSVHAQPTPDMVEAVCALPHLEYVDLSAPDSLRFPTLEQRIKRTSPVRVTMNGGAVARILAARRLSSLSVNCWILTDDDWAAIGEHETLEGLSINDTNVSEKALAEIMRLPRLRRIGFNRCDVSGEALAKVAGSASLEFIECGETPLQEDAALFFARCPALEELYLWHASVNDTFVRRLQGHPSLRSLSLFDASVTDRCIISLRRMPALEGVALPKKEVTSIAVGALQKARSGLKISHYGNE